MGALSLSFWGLQKGAEERGPLVELDHLTLAKWWDSPPVKTGVPHQDLSAVQ